MSDFVFFQDFHCGDSAQGNLGRRYFYYGMYNKPTILYVGCGTPYGTKVFSINVNTESITQIGQSGSNYDYRINTPTIDTTNKVITLSENAGTGPGCSFMTHLPIDIDSMAGTTGAINKSYNFNSIGYTEVAWFLMLGYWCTKIYRIDLNTGNKSALLEVGPYNSRLTVTYDHSSKTLTAQTNLGLADYDGIYFVCGY